MTDRQKSIQIIAESCPVNRDGADLGALSGLCRKVLSEQELPSSAANGGLSLPSRFPDTPKGYESWNHYCCSYLMEEYYPGHCTAERRHEMAEAVTFYLDVCNAVFDRERSLLPMDRTRDFYLLPEPVYSSCDSAEEYRKLLSMLRNRYLYAFMRLQREITPFNTLGHIAGVHAVSVYIASQLKMTDLQFDPAMVSGAAILHDIGKYGCRMEEASRVPYLHYYYTYQFAQRFDMSSIGAVASAHSVWDLELENLSAESLILIYADFRVKSRRTKDGCEEIRFLSLDESYDVILGKLDNVDDRKRRRYERVYAKLKDFENYLKYLGVSTDLVSPFRGPSGHTPYSLMSDQEMVEAFKYLAISQNLKVMYTTGHDVSFISLLEEIRAEKDWRHVRAFLTVIDEYSGYLNQDQKLICLDFLYEMLSHRDGDIRRQAARIAACVIARIEITFKKELPSDAKAPQIGLSMTKVWHSFLRRMLFPDHSVTEQHRRWIGYAMKTVVRTLLSGTDAEKQRAVLQVILEHYKSTSWEGLTCFLLLDCLAEIPCSLCSANQRKLLFRFDRHFLDSSDTEIKAAALRFILNWLKAGFKPDEEELFVLRCIQETEDDPVCVRYLIRRIRSFTGTDSDPVSGFSASLIYLENQRSEIPWIYKLVNLEILDRIAEHEEDPLRLYQYAAHLLNLLQFTHRVTNKLQAGENLVKIMPRLSKDQRYEIILELVRALDMGQYNVSKYIPVFFGQIYIGLSAPERQDVLDQLRELSGSSNKTVVILTLETASVILQYLPGLERTDPQFSAKEYDRLEGMLCCGTVHYDPEIAREAFYFLGEGIFASTRLSPDEKMNYFSDMSRKILTFIRWDEVIPLWYYPAASLNHIYRFLSDYLQEHEMPQSTEQAKIAFFPGTFDPFSLGHKAIVKEIASMGFHVYLAVDEFSWSKNTQPYRIRRKIMVMSVADLKNVFLFPIEIPVNIACPKDLTHLRSLFPEQEVYIVTGSDVIEHASAYRAEPSPGSVHSFPHILFARNIEESRTSERALGRIHGEILRLRLPAYYESMSSSRIRTNVSAGRGIDDLVVKVVQNYISEKGLYTMEPIYKRAARTRAVDTVITSDSGSFILELSDLETDGETVGRVEYHLLREHELLERSGSIALAQKLRSRISGKVAVITKISGEYDDLHDDRYSAFNEALSLLQERGFSYAMYFGQDAPRRVLAAHGFTVTEEMPGCYLCDLRNPLVLFFDTLSFIKEQFADEKEVQKALWQSHLKLRAEVAKLFPGQLVLGYHSDIMNYRMIRHITNHNPIPEVQTGEKILGEKICVPFGKSLKGVLVPQCVTKDLNTEKVYDIDMEHFSIREFPQYTPLRVQIRTIRSFMRDVILVDDIYHKGYRLGTVQKVMEDEGLRLDRLIVGVLSGRGNDLAHELSEPIDSVYYVPHMRTWLIESDLYPFIGGDGITCADLSHSSPSLPSVNSILPYYFPSFMKGASMEAFYHMSMVCIENARDIFLVLEKLYQKKYGRKLTVDRIGEVLGEPRHPDTCILNESSSQESISGLLEQELKKLGRLSHLLDGQFRL